MAQEEIRNTENIYIETHKWYAPYLLAASFQGLISLKGHYIKNGVVHWVFYPQNQALDLLNQLKTKTEPRFPVLDIFRATETFWEQITAYKKFSNKRSF